MIYTFWICTRSHKPACHVSKERKRDYDRARNAATSPEQRALLNKRRRESYASKKTAKKLEMAPKENAQSTGMVIKLIYLERTIIAVP